MLHYEELLLHDPECAFDVLPAAFVVVGVLIDRMGERASEDFPGRVDTIDKVIEPSILSSVEYVFKVGRCAIQNVIEKRR